MKIITIAFLIAAVSACMPDLGPCDEARARTLVYGPGGTPMYAGQAIVASTCAAGACHTEAASGAARRGAPFNLNFDAAPIRVESDGSPTLEAEDLAHTEILRAGRTSIVRHRREIYEAVLLNYMPPPVSGVRPGAAVSAYRSYAGPEDATGVKVEALDSIHTRDLLRNWLSCGAPFVERLSGQGRGVGYVEARRPTRPEPTWTSLYHEVIKPSCASATCHGQDGLSAAGGLDLGDPETAYESLCGGAGCPGVPARFRLPDVSACPRERPVLIVPGDAERSFFYRKVADAVPPCGARMPRNQQPLYPEEIAAMAAWIRAGAAAE